MDYKLNVGIEIHLQLLTKTKLFSPVPVTYGKAPNTMIDEVTLGYPGSLPQVNKQALRLAIRTALLLEMKINNKLSFDRKHYFYYDLPKGYQITQKQNPIAKLGRTKRLINGKKVLDCEIDYISLEEDTAKVIFNDQDNEILVDYNRCGNPLVEIVSKPQIKTIDQAIWYVKNIMDLMKKYEISNCDMSKGSMRCDINVSLSLKNSSTLGNKVEIKNLNSINNIKKAIAFEQKRQHKLLINNKKIDNQTRSFDEKTGETIFSRDKESIHDYNYIFESNIAPINITKSLIDEEKKFIEQKRQKILFKAKFNFDDVFNKTLDSIMAQFSNWIIFFKNIKANLINNTIKKFKNEYLKIYEINEKISQQTHTLSKNEFNKLLEFIEKLFQNIEKLFLSFQKINFILEFKEFSKNKVILNLKGDPFWEDMDELYKQKSFAKLIEKFNQSVIQISFSFNQFVKKVKYFNEESKKFYEQIQLSSKVNFSTWKELIQKLEKLFEEFNLPIEKIIDELKKTIKENNLEAIYKEFNQQEVRKIELAIKPLVKRLITNEIKQLYKKNPKRAINSLIGRTLYEESKRNRGMTKTTPQIIHKVILQLLSKSSD